MFVTYTKHTANFQINLNFKWIHRWEIHYFNCHKTQNKVTNSKSQNRILL